MQSILQWNVRGASASKQDLLKLIEDHKPLVVALQETFLGGDFKIKLPGYVGLCRQGHYNVRFHGGVALYIHSSCPYEPININTNHQVIAARIHLGHTVPVTIASIYLPGRENVSDQSLSTVIEQLPTPFLFLGDYNAHNVFWGTASTDARGLLVARILDNHSIICLNDGTATHISGTSIDLSIASPLIEPLLHWSVLPSVLSSDHYPIKITIATTDQSNRDPLPRYNYKKANWELYSVDPVWQSIPSIESFSDCREILEDLYSRLTSAANNHIPRYVPKRFYPVPYWNAECQRLWNERERLYRLQKRSGLLADKISWKRARALTKKTIKQSKEQELHDYLSSMKHTTPMSIIYQKLRQMRGKPPRSISFLKDPRTEYTSHIAIANKLADSFASISSYEHCPPAFQRIRLETEQCPLDFNCAQNPSYNSPFTNTELKSMLQSAKNTTPGPDEVHYLMLKNLPDNAQDHLLRMYNKFWTESYYPPQWRTARIIPIPKPGKDHTDATNYRPIALTSCLGKLMEKLINRRLMEHLEYSKLLSPFQSGFRKYRSTLDHLVRLDTHLRHSFASKKVSVGVFFDLAKAYDTTWRYGILRDLHLMGLRGNLPKFIREFLRERKFHVVVGSAHSTERMQIAGIPQGCILSVTLFAIKINSISSIIPKHIHHSLFVDDVQITYADHSMHKVNQTLQPVINAMYTWATHNGFTFSPSKTQCIVFHSAPNFPLQPNLSLNNIPLLIVPAAKFLGLHWDSQLNWKHHVNNLVTSCHPILNLLRTLTSLSWGADMYIMHHIYKLVLRPKLDYGCIVYGSASDAMLGRIQTIQNDALRICSGAFRSSPVKSMQVLFNEPSLSDRRDDLLCRFFFKTRCFISNPVHQCFNDPILTRFLANSAASRKSIPVRSEQTLTSLSIATQPVLPFRSHPERSWCLFRPTYDTNLVSPLAKSIPNFYPLFRDYADSTYPNFKHVYTDGSRDDSGVGSAAVFGHRSLTATLPKVASVFTAELHALKLALSLITNHLLTQPRDTRYLICTDSLSAIQALQSVSPPNQLVRTIQHSFHSVLCNNITAILLWVPGHSRIPGNDQADSLAKQACTGLPEFIPCPYTDWNSTINEAISERWSESWSQGRTHLKAVKPTVGKWKKLNLPRRQSVIISRLRLGHTNLTHSYHMDPSTAQGPPPCLWCNTEPMTVEHILQTCNSLTNLRTIHLADANNVVPNLHSLLGDDIRPANILNFLRAINIYDRI